MQGPARLSYLKQHITHNLQLDPNQPKPLSGVNVLDVGCGGGLICEPFARMGANVTGLDPSATAISAAKHHAEQQNLSINYQNQTIETYAESTHAFDVVTMLEVIEHVANVQTFLEMGVKCLRPGGLLIISTLNRTLKSFGLAIVGAEYILRWLPTGTHDWNKFVTPHELQNMVEKAGCKHLDTTGIIYNPLQAAMPGNGWVLSNKDCDVNYFFTAQRN